MEVQKWKKKKERALNEGNLDNLFYACKELAEIYFREEKYDKALREYKEMANASEACGNRMDVARANRMIGEVYSEKGEFDKAVKHQLIHLSISCEEGNKVEEQRALATLGRTYFLQAESIESDSSTKKDALHQAKIYYMKSLSVCEQLGDEVVGSKQKMEMRARLFLNIGLVQDSQNHYEDAIEHMSKAIMICKKLDLWEDLYRTYAALGSMYQRQGDKAKAISTYDQALIIAGRLGNKVQLMCEILPLKAEILLDLPDFRGARQTLLRAYKLKSPSPIARQEIERKLRIVAAMCECEEKLINILPEEMETRKKLYEQIADMAADLNHYAIATTYYNSMLECVEKSGRDRKALIECYVSLSQTYKDNKQYVLALHYFKKELELESEIPIEACTTSLNIAEIYQLLGKTKEMIETYESAKAYANQVGKVKLTLRVLRNMHKSLMDTGKFDLADEVALELTKPEFEGVTDSESEEEESEPQEFGAHIYLDDLTDPEDVGDNEEYDRPKGTRHRTVRSRPFLQRRNEKGETPLHVAAIQGNVTLVQKLIEQGHALDVKDFSGWTPLHEACNHGHKEVVEVLLSKGANINDRGGPMCDGVTPLLDAASNGCLDIITLLLDKGASPLVRTNKGETVIDCLSAWRERYIADVGADLDSSSLSTYNHLYKKLEKALEKAGQKISGHKKENKVSPKERDKKMGKSLSGDFSATGSLRRNSEGKEERERERRRHSLEGAASEYENAIKALRPRNKPDKILSLSLSKSQPSQPALLTEDQTVGDNWLEEDMDLGRPKKKRRVENFLNEPQRKHKEQTYLPLSPIRTSQLENRPTYNISDGSEESNDAPSRFESRNGHKHDEIPSTSGVFSNKLKVMNSVRRRQISLMSTGVTCEKVKRGSVERSSSPESIEFLSESPVEPERVPSPPATQKKRTNFTTTPMASVKVRVEGKLFLVPVPGDLEDPTIGWLAQETSKRYYSLEGVEPTLRLCTEDGAMLVDSDPISLIMGSNEILGTVQNWKLAPLTTRYKEACLASNTNVDNHLRNILEASQATGSVSLEDLFLSQERLVPFLKALSHHYPLQVLDLSGNNIGDQGIKVVAECIVKLPELQCLDLTNINLSAEGLHQLAVLVAQNSALQRLHTLKLGYNPLGDCLKPLSSLLNTIPALNHLHLPHVGLTVQSFRSSPQFTLESLQTLDLNNNRIGVEGLTELLGRLDSRNIISLKLSCLGERVVREIGMFLEYHQPPALQHLDLSYCSATSEDIDVLIKGLQVTPGVETLILDGNKEITRAGVQSLLDLDLKHLSLAGVLVEDVLQLPSQFSSLVISSCVDQPWASPAPHALYTTTPLPTI